jgi:hypothetical protein
MTEFIDINSIKYLPCTVGLPIFDIALMMKSKTSKVAMKPPVIKSWGLLLNQNIN